ncbi:hypothetical protein BSZ22_01190 [Bradyrhizobium canariense]|uniref:Uncharacterized protein n=1 Tax=Bradyrhizobium canariense TaxID=255045 RepID=A0A1X3GTT1_9BRAD|nr:hypothetical protein BST65_24800 [Bradyrhizobium canariense]OSI28142.1 hypothetical protein BST66_30475 [Bradyrhizobium canariense]OSI42077.1 hypothetical protein BSZ20_18645 [Bradyrhizobium canariense]OSI46971.1 hypothetical protein BST67_21590 [Bradyrhizobium canariense]OSI48427.1 hypothetical protein BSZ15_37970 [Bradyrhizobium canariense]
MRNLCLITSNQAAIIALFRLVNRYVGNLAPMPGVSEPFGSGFSEGAGCEIVTIAGGHAA